MLRRTCVARALLRIEKSFSVCPASGERSSSSAQAPPRAPNRRAVGAPARSTASSEHSAGWLPRKLLVSTVTARITPGTPSRTMHQSYPGPQGRRVEANRGAGMKHNGVGAPAGSDRALAGEPREPGRPLGVQTREVLKAPTAGARPGPGRGEGQLDRRDPAPRPSEVARFEAFQGRRCRRVVARHEIDGSIGEPAPQAPAGFPLPGPRGPPSPGWGRLGYP